MSICLHKVYVGLYQTFIFSKYFKIEDDARGKESLQTKIE